MIEYFFSQNGGISQLDECRPGAWINVTDPTQDEVQSLIDSFGLDPDFIRSSLDEEETSHIESEDSNTLIVIDTPHVDKLGDSVVYSTVPLGIIVAAQNVITVSLHENDIINEFSEGIVRGVNTDYKTQFVLKILLRSTTRFLQYLRQIDRLSSHVEQEIRKSMRNSELMKLIDINKSLVYFSTSLKGNEITIEKMSRGRFIKLYEEDQDLLEDVLIEVRQAIEMATIYSTILAGTLDASSSLISNSLNDIMKILASITIVISIPTIISGLYGMNIENGFLPLSRFWWFPCVLSVVVMIATAYILRRKNML